MVGLKASPPLSPSLSLFKLNTDYGRIESNVCYELPFHYFMLNTDYGRIESHLLT